LGYGVWALAIKYVSFSFFRTILMYVVNPWYPKKFININSLKRHFGFGSKLLLSGIIDKVFQNIYKIVIGKYFNATTLGFFTQAKLFVSQVTQDAVSTLQTVTYPILSKTKNEPERLKDAYRKIIKSTSFIIFPLVLGLGILAEPFILTLVG
jgi:O-antigen/teichoic acid export membrane protein